MLPHCVLTRGKAQDEHAVLSAAEAYVPDGHGEQNCSSAFALKKPGMQGAISVLFFVSATQEALALPLADAQTIHSVEPSNSEKVPTGQGRQRVAS